MTGGLRRVLAGLAGLAVMSSATAPHLSATAPLAQGIVSYRLENGLTLVVAPRPDLGLAAVNLTVAFGSADDPPGRSGLAHLLEHVSLSGTAREGSLDAGAEIAALRRVDEAELAAERQRQSHGLDLAALGELRSRAEQAAAAARQLAEPGDVYGLRLEARGAIGLNAVTSSDTTQFFCRIPSDQVETWMAFEADRLRNPLFRHFYAERATVVREIATLTGGRPTAQDSFLQELFPGRPEAQPVFGNPRELGRIDRPFALERFQSGYRPDRVVLVVIGNVRAADVLASARRHFGTWAPSPALSPPAPESPPVAATPSSTMRSTVFNSASEPIAVFGFPRTGLSDRDEAALTALAELIGTPLLSPLHRQLIGEKGLAWDLGARVAVPGLRFQTLFFVQVFGQPGAEPQLLTDAARAAFEALPETGDDDLMGAILGARVRFAGGLQDPLRLASQLASSQILQGDWRRVFALQAALAALRPDDLKSAARRYLAPSPVVALQAGGTS
jgi:predicted Zn-dependent peptidase